MTRKLTWILMLIFLILQGQLWLGRGSLPNVMQLRETLANQIQTNQQDLIRNQRQEAELGDLKEGKEMVGINGEMKQSLTKYRGLLILTGVKMGRMAQQLSID